MNNDGLNQTGAGSSDTRIAGKDLQHNRQTRTADEQHEPVRMVRQTAQQGGPMKEHMTGEMHKGLAEHLEMEKAQHGKAKEHAHKHMERHNSRHHDTQHGHENAKHEY